MTDTHLEAPGEFAATSPPAEATVSVLVNGERRTLPRGTSVADLLRQHDLSPRLVVVELNRTILRDRDAFPAIRLADGDAVELVHFVGGG